jgi:glycosyltransferase involved in cell wall biosynthesis
MPTSMLEAMALKCPILATPIGGILEVIKNGVNGILVSPGDPKILSETIIKLMNNPSLRDELAKNGRETIEREYDLNKKISQQLNYFLSFFGNSGT